MNMEIQRQVDKVFRSVFGRTPLNQRLEDIMRQVQHVDRWTDMEDLKQGTGNLLASVLELCNENGWDATQLVNSTLEAIEARKEQYATLGRKIRVVVLGTAADPVTFGHTNTIRFVLNETRAFDEAWIMPAYKHLFGKEMAPAEDRLTMCRLATQNNGRIRVSNFEIKHELAGETYHCVKLLQESPEFKDKYEFAWIIGMDNANTFHTWLNYEYLERMARFVIVSRPGVKRDPNINWYLKPPHIYLGEYTDAPKISSTMVKDLIKRGEDVLDYIDPKVLEYIRHHKLYA